MSEAGVHRSGAEVAEREPLGLRIVQSRNPENTGKDPITGEIIAAAIEVHRALGPGLLESAYQACLEQELNDRCVPFESQVEIPVEYKGRRLDCGYRLDLVVRGEVIIEIKAVDSLAPIHEAQLLTYLRLARLQRGLLLNFNTPYLRDGVKRLILSSP